MSEEYNYAIYDKETGFVIEVTSEEPENLSEEYEYAKTFSYDASCIRHKNVIILEVDNDRFIRKSKSYKKGFSK